MSASGPVFVIGAPRSGTSLLQYLLSAHPDLAYPDMALRDMWSHRSVRLPERLGLPATRSRRLHARFVPEAGTVEYEPTLRLLGLEPLLPVEGLFLWLDRGIDFPVDQLRPGHLQADPEIAERIRGRYRSLTRRLGCSTFVDKSPSYTVMLEAVREVFPTASIVHAIRDGRAVVNSVAYAFRYRKGSDGAEWTGTNGSWWGPAPRNAAALATCGVVERAANQWRDLVEVGRRGRQLFEGRYHEVRYEDLVASTRREMLRLLDAMGLASGGDIYPLRLENRNYKWQDRQAQTFGDSIWTDRSAIMPGDYEALETMRSLLETLGYVERGAEIAAIAA